MRVGGSAGAASWDTEMLNSGNRMKLNTTPLAFVANNVRTANRTSTASDNIAVETGTTTTSGTTGTITIQSGNSAGASGNVSLNTGTSGSSVGILTLSTGGIQRLMVSNATTIFLGNAGTNGLAAAPNASILQGTGSSTAATAGGAVTLISGAGNTTGTGGLLTLRAGAGGATGVGGNVTIQAGTGGSTSGVGGNVTIQSGVPGSAIASAGNILLIGSGGGLTAGDGGDITLTGGSGTSGASNGGAITLTAGNSTGGAAAGGPISITAGNHTGLGGSLALASGNGGGANTGGPLTVTGGQGGATGAGAATTIRGGAGGATSGAGGALTLQAGNATAGNSNGGAVTLNGGTATGSGTAGGVNIGTAGVASTIQIGNTTGAVTQTINIGNNATASSTSNITIGSTIAGTTTLQGLISATGAVLQGTNTTGLTFEGATADAFETTLAVVDPTVGDQIFRLPNAAAAGTFDICTSANNCTTLGAFIQNGTANQNNANFNIQSTGTTNVTAKIRANTSQTADLLQVRNSTDTTTLFAVQADGDVEVDGTTLFVDATNNRVGIGTAVPDYRLEVVSAPVTDATNGTGISFGATTTAVTSATNLSALSVLHTFSPTTAYSGVASSVYGQLTTSDADASGATLAGVLGLTRYTGTASNTGSISGVRGSFTNASSGNVTDAAALYAGVGANSGGGTITNTYGVYVGLQTAGTNNYGVYITGGSTAALRVVNGTTNLGGDLVVDTNTLFVDATANEVGIGTATPASILDIVASGTNSIRLTAGASWPLILQQDASSNFTINNDNNVRLTVLAGGNVGIGDTTPASLLSVGNGDLFQVDGTTGFLTIVSGAGDEILFSGSNNASILGNSDIYIKADADNNGGTENIFLQDGGSNNIFQSSSNGQNTFGNNFTAATLRVSDGNGQYISIATSDVAADRTISIPVATGNDTFCLNTLANCTGLNSKWTDAGAFTYLTNTADRLIVGQSTDVTTTKLAVVSTNSANNVSTFNTRATLDTTTASTRTFNTWLNTDIVPTATVGTNTNYSVLHLWTGVTSAGRLDTTTDIRKIDLYTEFNSTVADTIGSASNIYTSDVVNTNVTVSDFRNIFLNDPGGAGTITRNAALVVANQTKGAGNTNILVGTTTIPTGANWSIYNSSNYNNLFQGSIVANNSATGTTRTTEAVARTNVTTVTTTVAGFANNDVIFINNAGQDYYTRITAGGGTTTLTVSPAVSYDASATVTLYQNIANIGATTTDYTTQTNRFFQGYFLGGVVTGAGSTTLSDGVLNSTTNLVLQPTSGSVGIGTSAFTGLLNVGTVAAGGNQYSFLDGLRISGDDVGNTIYNAGRNIRVTADTGTVIGLCQTNTTCTGLQVTTSTGNAVLSGSLTVASGTAGAPSINFAGATNQGLSFVNTPDSSLPWSNGPVITGGTGWAYYSQVAGSYRMGFRGNSANSIRYLWSADSVLIGEQPNDLSVTATLNVVGTARVTSTLTVGGATDASGQITARTGLNPYWAGADSGLTGARHYQYGYQSPGAWSGTYPNLILGYHTGVDLGANTGYGGVQFFNDHPSVSSTLLMAVGNGDNNVRVYNNLYLPGDAWDDIGLHTDTASPMNSNSNPYIVLDADRGDSLGACRTYIQNTGTGGNTHIDTESYLGNCGGGGAVYLNWYQGGGGLRVGNGTSSGYAAAYASAFTVSSSRRWKTNIIDSTYGLSQINAMQPVTFDYTNGTNGHQLGLIAEDVLPLVPEVVIIGSDGLPEGIDYGKLSALLITGVKQLDVKVNTVSARLALVESGNFSGSISVVNDVYVGDKLTVVGDAEIQGNLVVAGDTELAQLTVNGKLISKGILPTLAIGQVLTSVLGASVTNDGTDTAGTVEINSGMQVSTAGEIATVTFTQPYTTAPKIVLSGNNAKSAKLGAYIERTVNGFIIKTDDPLEQNINYSFDYIIVQAEDI
jgi:hypothetical protein